MGIIISFSQCCFADIGIWIAEQNFVRLRFTKSGIRGIVPRQCDVEHAIEKSIVDEADVADRDMGIDISHGVWFPQREPMRWGREFCLVNEGGLIHRDGGTILGEHGAWRGSLGLR